MPWTHEKHFLWLGFLPQSLPRGIVSETFVPDAKLLVHTVPPAAEVAKGCYACHTVTRARDGRLTARRRRVTRVG